MSVKQELRASRIHYINKHLEEIFMQMDTTPEQEIDYLETIIDLIKSKEKKFTEVEN